MAEMIACQTCGQLQRTEPPVPRAEVLCSRCGFEIHRDKPDSISRTMALALGALILYFPGILFPIVKTQYMGMEETTTVFDGIAALFGKGNYLVGTLIFATSIINPGLKVVALLLLCITHKWPRWLKFRSWVYKILQVIDPWSMLQVTLLALIVAMTELGKVASVQPGPGLYCYAAFVVLTISASVVFDKRLVWHADDKLPDKAGVQE